MVILALRTSEGLFVVPMYTGHSLSARVHGATVAYSRTRSGPAMLIGDRAERVQPVAVDAVALGIVSACAMADPMEEWVACV